MKKGFARQLPKCLLPYPSAQALLRDLLCDCIGSFLYAVGVVTFAKQANFAPGGVTGIAIIVNHFCPFLKIGMLTVLINAPVAVICYRLLGHDFFVKSIKSMLISAFFLDHMLYGSGSQKVLLVISDKSDEIAWVITHELERGVTLLTGKGGYTQQARPMLFCVCSKIEVASTRKIVYRIDPTAMVMLSTVDEAYGLGFSKLEET